jgi:hypothetical protein
MVEIFKADEFSSYRKLDQKAKSQRTILPRSQNYVWSKEQLVRKFTSIVIKDPLLR